MGTLCILKDRTQGERLLWGTILFGAKTFLLRKRHLRCSLKDEDIAKLKGGAEELASAKAGRWGPGSIWELKGME